MTNKKISALTGATTPLVGTELVPIVQSSATTSVSVANLTAGRDVAVKNLSATGAVAIGTTGTYSVGSIYSDANWGMLFTAAKSAPGAAEYAWLNYAGTEMGRFTNTTGNDFKVTTGNVVIGTSGKGIDFSATAGTGTSELLADYEEGTWTPVLTPSTSGTITITSPTNSMSYTKVGRVVTISGVINITSVSLPIGDLRLTGLPFSAGISASGSILVYGFGITSVVTAYQVAIDTGLPTTVLIRGYFNGGQVATVADNVQAGSGFYLTVQYTV
jgi:hypothetical protein